MEAIHNGFAFGFDVAAVVYDPAKLAKMKAILNTLIPPKNCHLEANIKKQISNIL